MALLIHNQAEFVASMRDTDRELVAHWRKIEELSRDVEQLKADMAKVIAMLQPMHDAIRDKMGFKAPSP